MIHSRKVSLILSPIVIAALLPQARADVSFTGIDEALEKNARALVALSSAPCDAATWRVKRLYKNADTELREAFEALGYYRFGVDKSLSIANGECWHATFAISLGEPVKIRDVDIVIDGAAADDPGLDRAVELQPQPGELLNHGQYEAWKKSVLSSLTTRGYFDAESSESNVIIDEYLQHADISLRIDSGERYRFGEVAYDRPILRPELLAGYVRFKPGDPYDSREIGRLHERLSGSRYFGSVSIQAQPVAGEGLDVPVIVKLTPGKRRVFTAGAGYATDTGIQGRLGYSNRRRNDQGHQFDARLFLSSVDSELTGTYRWPRGRPDSEWVDLYGGFLRKRTDTSKSDKTTLGMRLTRNRTEDWLESPYLEFTREDFRVGEQLDTSVLVMPGIRWETTVGRDLKRVPAGHRMSLDLRGASDKLLSDTTFAQATASAKWITTLGSATRLLARTDLGATVQRDFDELPATVRFFAGGDTSVRGYEFETIGPVDDEGNVIGGSNLVVLSLEADWTIRGNWAIATFVDSGSAFNGTDIDMKTGVGLGIRWYSPVGPIRFDIAHPLDDPETDYRFHLTLGPDL